MTNWKEQLKDFQGFGFPTGLSDEEMKALEKFISVEIIAKLIDEIPERPNHKGIFIVDPVVVKQQLKDKWL